MVMVPYHFSSSNDRVLRLLQVRPVVLADVQDMGTAISVDHDVVGLARHGRGAGITDELAVQGFVVAPGPPVVVALDGAQSDPNWLSADLEVGKEQDDGAPLRDQALLDPDGVLLVSGVGLEGVREFVVPAPGLAPVPAEGVLAPAVQVVVAGVGIERHDVAVGIFHADRSPVGAPVGRIVLEIGDDISEDVIAHLGGRIVIVDHGAVDGVELPGFLLRHQMSGRRSEHPPKGHYQGCNQTHSPIHHRLSSSDSETVRRRLTSLAG